MSSARSHLRAVPPGESGAASGPPAPDDAAIVAGLLRREPAAAAALYDRCHRVVERALVRVLRSRDADFEDLVQATFERLLVAIRAGRCSEGVPLPSWAAAVAAHAAIDVIRARVRERRRLAPSHDPDAVLPQGAHPERRLEARSDVERVQAILARMRPDQAQALVLHDVFGHDLAEVAALLGVTIAAAQSRLSRGRRELIRRAGPPAEERP